MNDTDRNIHAHAHAHTHTTEDEWLWCIFRSFLEVVFEGLNVLNLSLSLILLHKLYAPLLILLQWHFVKGK